MTQPVSTSHATSTAPVAAATGGVFVTTRWTRVLAAQGGNPEARAALGELCEAYWTPVFRFLSSERRNEDQARELTQEFFSRILSGDGFANATPQRGQFRSFLLGAVKHFLVDLRVKERALKRGGGIPPESLSGAAEVEAEGSLQIADSTAVVPDSYFDRQWALALMERAYQQLAGEMAAAGKTAHFEVLKPWLAGEAAGLSQASAALALGFGEGAVKVAIHRLRKRFREFIRAEIAQTLPEHGEVDEELRYLVEVLVRS